MSSTWANTQHVFHWIRTHIHSQTSFMSSTCANTQPTGSYDTQPDNSPVVKKNLSVVPLSIGDKIACRLINTTSSHYHRHRPLERDHLPPHQTPFCLPLWALSRMPGIMFKSDPVILSCASNSSLSWTASVGVSSRSLGLRLSARSFLCLALSSQFPSLCSCMVFRLFRTGRRK